MKAYKWGANGSIMVSEITVLIIMDNIWPGWEGEAEVGIPLQAIYWLNVLRIKRSKEQNRADNAAKQGCDRKWNSISLVPEKSGIGLSNNYLLIKSILSSLIQSLLPTCCWLSISRVAAKELKFKFKFNSG